MSYSQNVTEHQCTCGCSHSPKVQVVMDLGLDLETLRGWLAGSIQNFGGGETLPTEHPLCAAYLNRVSYRIFCWRGEILTNKLLIVLFQHYLGKKHHLVRSGS